MQDVHRRVGTAVAVGVFTLGAGALVALSKSKKHFLGLTWADGDKKGGLPFSAIRMSTWHPGCAGRCDRQEGGELGINDRQELGC